MKAIKNDITNFQFATPRAVQDVTGVDKSAMERLLLLADFSVTLNGVMNVATGASHDVFKTVPSTSVARTTTIAFTEVGGSTVHTLANEVLYTDYPITRGQDGALTWAVPGVLSDGTVPSWTSA
ncbi:hypothetical protein GCM10022254_09990 [Actinomadura meridiana]|uniref:Uncharacterized protein n=1 Tax=Actinomadura meridiana TaxID=559626 RepID=A0ABP8BV48_9ACTN